MTFAALYEKSKYPNSRGIMDSSLKLKSDEQALVRALREGWIAGAGLDVTEEEPLPPESPLYSMPNVILTPHISGNSVHYDTRLAALFADNLKRYRSDQELLNQYEPSRGY